MNDRKIHQLSRPTKSGKPMLAVVEHKKSPRTPNIVTEITVVTPDIARAWLGQNKKNRNPSATTITKYAADMKEGLWKLTGDCIRFDTNKNLIDGQHRLMACIKANASFPTVVVYSLPPEVQDIIDTGKVRRPQDVLQLRGLHNTTMLTAALRLFLVEKEFAASKTTGNHSTTQITKILDKHPKITRYITPPGTFPRGISGASVGFIAYVGSELIGKPSRSEAMVNVLKVGAPDYENDPIHRWRERIIRSNDGTTALKRTDIWYTLKYAWNLFAEKKPLEKLAFNQPNAPIKGLDVKLL